MEQAIEIVSVPANKKRDVTLVYDFLLPSRFPSCYFGINVFLIYYFIYIWCLCLNAHAYERAHVHVLMFLYGFACVCPGHVFFSTANTLHFFYTSLADGVLPHQLVLLSDMSRVRQVLVTISQCLYTFLNARTHTHTLSSGANVQMNAAI